MQYEEFHSTLTIDAKGRLTLPKSMRDTLASEQVDKLVMLANRGPLGGLYLYTPDEYRRIKEATIPVGSNPFHPAAERLARAVFSTSQTVQVDANGRILVPPNLRAMVGLDRDVTLFTSMDRVELWDTARWNETYLADLEWWKQKVDEAYDDPFATLRRDQ